MDIMTMPNAGAALLGAERAAVSATGRTAVSGAVLRGLLGVDAGPRRARYGTPVRLDAIGAPVRLDAQSVRPCSPGTAVLGPRKVLTT